LLNHLGTQGKLLARGERLAAEMQADFDLGMLLLETEFAIPMQACARRERIGLMTRRGVNRRAELVQSLKLDPQKPIYLIYLGQDGLAGMRWERLTELEAQFIAYSVPPGAEPWVHALPRHAIHHADAAASVDAVIAKPGYGLCAECMACGTRLLYVPRPHFSEADAIAAALDRWGGAIQVPEEQFRALEWAKPLAHLRLLTPDAGKTDLTGGAVAAQWIMKNYRS
jgi:hypothetical protein